MPTLRQVSACIRMAICQSTGNAPSLEVRLEKESVWLNLNQMAALFERDKSVIARYLSNVYREG